ncbi:DUF3761 domain-containing protein [Mycobacterium szulgai]|uniref:DUF3761 domain-containing protein n=1 Tax=Mycobacterium szulgai TaxID=1787 RepID=UPI000A1FD8E9|nr:DUF3761 domain-containing protein [Mycobacterium szulgai]MCV7075106.1 DUF3761 domain-containing protein [Mycobacterium szulgai]
MRVRLLIAVAAASVTALGVAPGLFVNESMTLANCGSGYYQNSDGKCIPRPTPGSPGGGAPPGATAICRDGDYSFSTHHSGTCSGHGGVQQWITN